ncbi:MAG: hypothetical protein AAFZ15_28630 [Bacteroidota bacterium]
MKKGPFSNGLQNTLYIFTIIVFSIAAYHFETGVPPILMSLLGAISGLLANVIFIFICKNLGIALNKLPLSINAIILGSLATLFFAKSTILRFPDKVFYPAVLVGIACSLLFYYGFKKIFSKNNSKRILPLFSIGAAAVFFIAGLYWLFQSGNDPYAKKLASPSFHSNLPLLSSKGFTNPALNGNFKIDSFTYGSGNDKKRKEYAKGVKYKTLSVNASRLLPDWKEKKKKWRERFWGFGVKNFPLNGRTYMPKGEGPFPLILIVHGNHSMIDYSDNGYGYLGELLASRGFITVSVDENFINGHWSGDFRGKEMPTRAWLLLKHLEQWKEWNNTAGHDLANKVDLDNILLIGHSRGGEAVSIAAAFNRLPHFPDDALEAFNFNFNIKGIVTLAPTDYRYHRKIKLENINYLSLQGSYDADEVSFWGMRPYRRLKFTDKKNWFKAGVYIHRANHGQFNSTWGRADFGGTFKWLLNTAPLIKGDEQREVAKIFITIFAEAALKNNKGFLPIFQNAATAKDWLPENYYLTFYNDSSFKNIVNFEEDINIKTAPDQISINAKNFKIWREENLQTRDQGSQDNNVVILGWNYGEKIITDSLARYKITFPDSLNFNIDTSGYLTMTIATGNFMELDKGKKKDKKKNLKKRKEPKIDFRIVLTDNKGKTAQTKISDTKAIAPMLKSRFTKLKSLDKEMIGNEWEIQPEAFFFSFKKFQKNNNNFNFSSIQKIELIFDQCNYGVVAIDDIAYSIIKTK